MNITNRFTEDTEIFSKFASTIQERYTPQNLTENKDCFIPKSHQPYLY